MNPQEQAKFEEEWRPVVGFEGYYEVSNMGSVKRTKPGRGIRVGRILKQKANKRGYPVVQLWKDNHGHGQATHCVVARAFLGPAPDGAEVNHKDGNKTNPVLSNLEYVTRSGNITHAYRVGLRVSGASHNWAKLTESQVKEIRSLHVPGEYGCRRLARRFGVSKNTIQLILNGQNWAHERSAA
jgi:hypothetical protein